MTGESRGAAPRDMEPLAEDTPAHREASDAAGRMVGVAVAAGTDGLVMTARFSTPQGMDMGLWHIQLVRLEEGAVAGSA